MTAGVIVDLIAAMCAAVGSIWGYGCCQLYKRLWWGPLRGWRDVLAVGAGFVASGAVTAGLLGLAAAIVWSR